MTTELTLHQTHASGRLLPARLAQAFALLAKTSPASPRGAMRGQELRLGRALAPDDGAAAGFMLDFIGQGDRVRGAARSPRDVLLVWAFHALAAATRCRLATSDGAEIAPEPERHREAALAYLADYEEGVRATRSGERDAGLEGFLAFLVADGHLALAAGEAIDEEVALDDPSGLYELLLESDAVDDVFVSERELTALLESFRARSAR